MVLCYHRIIPDQFLKLGRSFDPKESELAYYTIGTDEFASQLKYLGRVKKISQNQSMPSVWPSVCQ